MDDLISRQAVIEMLDETRRIAERNIDDAVLMTFEKVLDSLVNITNALPTIQPEPHWIPVDLENNEPQLEEWVLVSSDGYVMQDCIVERGGKKIWYHGGNIQADDRYMPLPEAFKGVTE